MHLVVQFADDDLTTETVDAELAQHTYVFVALSVIDKIRFMQQSDPATKQLIRQLEQIGPKTIQLTGDVEHYEVINGILHRRYGGRRSNCHSCTQLWRAFFTG